jgi:hypothetical protein
MKKLLYFVIAVATLAGLTAYNFIKIAEATLLDGRKVVIKGDAYSPTSIRVNHHLTGDVEFV